MGHNSIKTVHHAKLEEQRSLNITFTADTYSTLNEFFNQNTGVATPAEIVLPSTGKVKPYPIVQYLAVGNYPVDPTENIPAVHRPTDGSLYKHMPWIVREIGDDLDNISPPYRRDYALRVEVPALASDITYQNGLTLQAGYIYYFLKLLDTDAVTPDMKVINIINGSVNTSSPYVLTTSDLSTPQRVDVTNDTLNLVTGNHINVQAAISIQLNSTDITELLASTTHLYGDSTSATITEFGIASAYDPLVNDTDDVSHAQIVNFIGAQIPLQGSPTDLNFTFALGNTMPWPAVITP